MVPPLVNASVVTLIVEGAPLDAVEPGCWGVACAVSEEDPDPQPATSRRVATATGVVRLMSRIVLAPAVRLKTPGRFGHRSFGRYAGKAPTAGR
jgi:hypothetical protein